LPDVYWRIGGAGVLDRTLLYQPAPAAAKHDGRIHAPGAGRDGGEFLMGITMPSWRISRSSQLVVATGLSDGCH
jgi:hypothetical protein